MEDTQKPTDPQPEPSTPEAEALRNLAIDTLKTCYDPEIPVNIYELGLIYEVRIEPGEQGQSDIHVRMTLTSPMCPVAESLPREVEGKLRALSGVEEVRVDVVWEPPWNMTMMSEAAKLQLNMF